MKKTIFLVALSLTLTTNSTLFGQKRPGVKPKTTTAKPKPTVKTTEPEEVEPTPTPTPQPTPQPTPTPVSPAQAFYNEGLKCSAEDYDCQISNYTKAINLELKTKEVFKNRGNAYLQRKDFDKAIADFSKLIELDPNDTNGYKKRGKIYLENSNSLQSLNAAIRDFTSAIDLEPKDVEAYKLRSSAFMKLRNFEKAKADMDKIAAFEPNNVDVIINQGEMFLTAKQYDKAIEFLTKAIKVKPSGKIYLNRANAYLAQKKYDFALTDYNLVIELEPRNAESFFGRGQIFAVKKNYDEAINDFTKAIELDSKNAQAYINRGWVYFFVENYENAFEDSNKAISISPNEEGGYSLRANSYYTKNRLKEPDAQYKADIEKFKLLSLQNAEKEVLANPQSAESYLKRGNVFHNNQQLDLAIADYNRAIELDPKTIDAYKRKGLVLAWKKQYDLAITEFTKGLEIDSQNVDLYSTRAAYFGIQEQYELAINDLTKAIEIESQNANLYDSRARQYITQNKYDLAINDLTKAIEIEPKEYRHRNSRANLYAKIKDYSKAEQDCQKIVEIDILQGADCYDKLASAAHLDKLHTESLGYYDKAESFLQKAIQLSPDSYQNYHRMGLLKEKAYWYDTKYQELFKKSNYAKSTELEIAAYESSIPYYLKCNELNNNKCDSNIADVKRHIELKEEYLSKMNAEKSERKARTWGIILNNANTVLSTISNNRQTSQTSQIPQPNTSSRPQTTQSGNTNGSVSSTGNTNNTSQNDPDFPAAMKGNVYINQSAPSYQCIRESCWGNWRTDSTYSQIQYSVLGPVLNTYNAVDNTPNVKSQVWHIQVKNTSSSIVEFKLKVIFGDGKETWVYFAIPPGGSAYKLDFHTLSTAGTIGVGVEKLRSCTNFTRVSNGYRCEQ